jgi:hypothetical protein
MSLNQTLPHSEACDRNQGPILQVLQQWFLGSGTVLEIGSGTGQHAVHFSRHLQHVVWQPTDVEENLAGIQAWVDEAGLPNLRAPLQLDVRDAQWPVDHARYAFSANTAHIMGWPEVQAMFGGLTRILQSRGCLCLYGPFNRDGEFTSDSNRAFDAMLRARDPKMGVRDDQAMIALGRNHGLALAADYAMPARNRLLVWTKG